MANILTKIFSFVSFKLLVFFISLIVVIVIIPLWIFLFSPIYLFRFIVSKSAKYFRPDLDKILPALSTNFSFDKFHNKNPASMIIVLNFMQGNVSLDTVRQAYVKRVLPYKLPNGELRFPELKQYPVDWMGFRFWKKDVNFDIKNHVKNYKNPDNEIVGEEELKVLEQEALARPFSKHQSPWDILIINNYYPKDNNKEVHTVFIMRVHHSIGDGYSINKLNIEGLCGQVIPKTNAKPNFEKKSLAFNILFPFRAMFEFTEMLLRLAKPSPLHVPIKTRTKSSVAVSNKIYLENLKKFKNKMDVSLSAVILSACAGALKATMKRKNIKVPSGIQCVLPFPKPGHPDTLRNHITQLVINLPMGSVTNPEDRMKLLNESYINSSNSTLPICNYILAKAIGGLFNPLAKAFAAGLVPSVLISNFPANFSNIVFEGHRISESFFYCGLCNFAAISFFVMSFDGVIRIAIVAERALLSLEDVEELVANVEHELLSYIKDNNN